MIRQWEDVDHDLEDSVAGALMSPTGSGEGDGDPLGLGSTIKWVIFLLCSKKVLIFV